MSYDLVEDEMEFRGGTLQLSSENLAENPDGSRTTDVSNRNTTRLPNSSVLSGADSLSSSSSQSQAEAKPIKPEAPGAGDTEPPIYPRYDMPFSRENIQDFFAYRKGVVENAIQECITVLLFPEDGEFLGAWLLTEITLWDNERERIVLLTSRLVMTIKYDFIAMKQLDFKKTYLDDLDTVVIGELVYPPSSLVPRMSGIATGVTEVVKNVVVGQFCGRKPTAVVKNMVQGAVKSVAKDAVKDKIFGRPADEPGDAAGSVDAAGAAGSANAAGTTCAATSTSDTSKLFDLKYFEPRDRNFRGVRLMWNKGEPVALKTAWNPFSHDVPFLTFASHPIFWHKEGDATLEERATFDMEVFAEKIQRAIESVPSSACCIHHSPIVIQSYVGVTSMLHNKTGMGFFKQRGKFSF